MRLLLPRGSSIFGTARYLLSHNIPSFLERAHLPRFLRSMASLPHKYKNFDLIKQFRVPSTDVQVSKWRSSITGLTIVHVDYNAPIVNGYFVVGTEIFDDSGCPHTLEHLVFMGSEKYPYKGIIDHLANRGFANGTNAWTDVDHTAYTVATAGGQGFLQLLPIYVDHILYPTMTKAGFITEVHHIDPQGHDSGVVYSEMQGRESTSGDLMALRLQQSLYPPGNAYRSETGGLMAAIRVLTVDQIRDYHHSYYVPHNLCLIVAGRLSTQSLLSVAQNEIEPSLIAHGQNHGPRPPGWKRPFIETPSAIKPVISGTVKSEVEFPEEDESQGELIISFLGPAPNQYLERKALDILSTYLTSSAVAPLNKEYIETESPLCTYIYFSEETRASAVHLPVYVGSVPLEHLDTFHDRLTNSLQRIVEEGIDMTRMSMVINRDERQLRSKLESSKGDLLSSVVISDFLYGKSDGSELEPSTDELGRYESLRQWSNDDWTSLLKTYYIDAPRVVVVGKPSAGLAEKIERDEAARLEEQIKTIGPEGLQKAARVLSEAKAEHDIPIPTKLLTDFPIPDVGSISWIPVESLQQPGTGRPARSAPVSELSKLISSDKSPLPFFIQYDHVESDFVTIHGLFSLSGLEDRLRPYISAYLSAFFALPVQRLSGERLSHEEVINLLDAETVSYESGLGMSGAFCDIFRVSIEVETSRYETAIAWLRDLVFGAEFDPERLQVTVAKLIQALPELKRDGSTILGSLFAELVFNKRSTSTAGGVLAQMEFLPWLATELQENPNRVVADFEAIRKSMTIPSGIRFSVTGNVLNLKNPRSTWAKYFPMIPESPLDQVPIAYKNLSPLGHCPTKKAIVMSLPTIESTFTTHSSRGIQGYVHAEYPAVRVALEVLNATESYLWRYIRGSGLAYGAYIGLDLEAGLISFTLYRSSNPIKAFEEASAMLKDLVLGKLPFDDTTIDAAKSSIVYGVARNVSTPTRAAISSFINQGLKEVPQNHQIELLQRFQAVTKADVLNALQQYFVPLFEPSSSVAVLVTAPGKAADIVKSLDKFGFEVEERSLQVDVDEDSSGSESESSSNVGSG